VGTKVDVFLLSLPSLSLSSALYISNFLVTPNAPHFYYVWCYASEANPSHFNFGNVDGATLQ
jgi:hypothetical protein